MIITKNEVKQYLIAVYQKKVTPQNLFHKLKFGILGPRSQYYLATIALQHYFPDKYIDDTSPKVFEEVKLVESLGFKNWHDLAMFYHKKISFSQNTLSNTDCVNRY